MHVETGETVHTIPTPDGTYCVAWHPSQRLLAFGGIAGKYVGEGDLFLGNLSGYAIHSVLSLSSCRDKGTVWLFGTCPGK